MKILYINCSRIPTERAHGLQIMKMCEAFSEAGSDVELWIPMRFNYVREDPFEYYGIKRDFVIKKIPCLDFIPLSRFFGPVALWVTEASFIFFVSAHSLIIFFTRSVGENNILYTRDKFVALFFSFFKKSIFFEAHDVPAGIFFSRFKKIRGVIAITQSIKDEFVRRGIRAEKIIVAPDGVDLDEFDIFETQEECRKKFGLPLDKKIVLYTGHLYPWKGADALMEAAKVSSIKYQVSSILFIFVGGTGKDIAEYQIRNTRYQIRNTRFAGHRPHREIPYWLKAADVLVLPNSAKYGISTYWTSPIKLFEYMASGRPIVASDLPSIREILSEKNAVFSEPDNPESIALAIEHALKNTDEGAIRAARAKEDVKAYTWEKRAENIWQFLQKK